MTIDEWLAKQQWPEGSMLRLRNVAGLVLLEADLARGAELALVPGAHFLEVIGPANERGRRQTLDAFKIC